MFFRNDRRENAFCYFFVENVDRQNSQYVLL